MRRFANELRLSGRRGYEESEGWMVEERITNREDSLKEQCDALGKMYSEDIDRLSKERDELRKQIEDLKRPKNTDVKKSKLRHV